MSWQLWDQAGDEAYWTQFAVRRERKKSVACTCLVCACEQVLQLGPVCFLPIEVKVGHGRHFIIHIATQTAVYRAFL